MCLGPNADSQVGGRDNLASSFWVTKRKVSKGDGPGQNIVP